MSNDALTENLEPKKNWCMHAEEISVELTLEQLAQMGLEPIVVHNGVCWGCTLVGGDYGVGKTIKGAVFSASTKHFPCGFPSDKI